MGTESARGAQYPIARAAMRFFNRHPILARGLIVYYALAVIALALLLRLFYSREIYAACLRHADWNVGRSDIDPILFIESAAFAGPEDEARFLDKFWKSYSRLRRAFPLLASHWELRIVRVESLMREEADSMRLQPRDWVPIWRRRRVRALQARLAGREDESTFAPIVDFRLNDVLQNGVMNSKHPRTLEARSQAIGIEKLDRVLEFWRERRELGPFRDTDAAESADGASAIAERLIRYHDLAAVECARARRFESSREIEIAERDRPAWMSEALHVFLAAIEIPADSGWVVFKTGTHWRSIRAALVMDRPSVAAADAALLALDQTRGAGASWESLACTPFLATREILEFQASHLAEFSPLDPWTQAARGVFDPGRRLTLRVPANAILKHRLGQLAADFEEFMLPRLLHRELSESPLHELGEFDTLVGSVGLVRDPEHWKRVCLEEGGDPARMRARLIGGPSDLRGAEAYAYSVGLAREIQARL